jgi:hypothetical protein
VDGLRNFGKECARAGEWQCSSSRALEFRDGPLGFVRDFPGQECRMRTKFAKQWNQDALEKSFSAAGELQCPAARKNPTRGSGLRRFGGSFEPDKIEKRKTDAQPRLRREVEGGGNVRKKKIVGANRNFIFVADATAAVAKKEPANDGSSRGADDREIGGDGFSGLLESDTGVAPGGTSEVRAVGEPRVVNSEEEVGPRRHEEMISRSRRCRLNLFFENYRGARGIKVRRPRHRQSERR